MPIFDLDQMRKRNSLKEDERVIIGYIDFSNCDEVLEEKSIGKLKVSRLGICSVEVYGNEGMYIPHVHVKSIDKIKGFNKPFDCCIKIDNPEYFSHSIHDSKFARTSQILEFNKWMHDLSGDSKYPTNWHMSVKIWKDANTYKINYDDIQKLSVPDYSLLK